MNYEFHPDALAEYEAAIAYYAERDPDVARRFVAVVEDAIGRIIRAPTRWRLLNEDVRRCLTRVFPYGVLYSIESDSVLILAIMHCSREPGYWQIRRQEP